ncbi:hypothetical protein BCON_0084g00270 [Botryotinia convoluta]|uniref:Uncharacterized protein n=1 Tax=Botryotinia convoluta TaxID=54673 RepID=A0A4Z1I2S8_9HELO|nr:hypothetical protein BCON_0084g00270 [Botryotinia convoluta]
MDDDTLNDKSTIWVAGQQVVVLVQVKCNLVEDDKKNDETNYETAGQQVGVLVQVRCNLAEDDTKNDERMNKKRTIERTGCEDRRLSPGG